MFYMYLHGSVFPVRTSNTCPKLLIVTGEPINTKLRNYSTFFYKNWYKTGLELLSAVGTQRFGGAFLAVTWQCEVFSWHSWRFLGSTAGSARGVLPHPSRTFQMGVRGLKRSPSTAGVPLKLPGQGRGSAVPPRVPRWRFLLCRVFSKSHTSLKSSK